MDFVEPARMAWHESHMRKNTSSKGQALPCGLVNTVDRTKVFIPFHPQKNSR